MALEIPGSETNPTRTIDQLCYQAADYLKFQLFCRHYGLNFNPDENTPLPPHLSSFFHTAQEGLRACLAQDSHFLQNHPDQVKSLLHGLDLDNGPSKLDIFKNFIDQKTDPDQLVDRNDQLHIVATGLFAAHTLNVLTQHRSFSFNSIWATTHPDLGRLENQPSFWHLDARNPTEVFATLSYLDKKLNQLLDHQPTQETDVLLSAHFFAAATYNTSW